MPSIPNTVESLWDQAALPALESYIRIPAVSPDYDREWETNGHLTHALELGQEWFQKLELKKAHSKILTCPGRTPVLLIEVAPSSFRTDRTTLLYGHMDKQPESHGWDPGKGPWTPVIEDNRLYGRGSNDDGYALFSALIAIKTLQDHGRDHGRCLILIETCEESGSFDLEYYLHAYEERMGTVDRVICLDSDCGDWDHMWITTSLRGLIEGRLSAALLTQAVHSGCSGIVASSFRVIRQLLDRIEDAGTGELRLASLNPPIPELRRMQAETAAQILSAPPSHDLPLAPGAQPMAEGTAEQMINSTWKPSLSYIAAQGFPSPDIAANILRPETALTLSFRTPPHTPARAAALELKRILENQPPHAAQVNFSIDAHADGWEMPPLGQDWEKRIVEAARDCFGHAPCYKGQGGSIPFMSLLSKRFPRAKILITGVHGPKAGAHGPNEFLDIPYVKKLTRALTHILEQPVTDI